ncbi:MAG: hypothetical protein CBB97_16225 [Candidatus Endolissoclinum sp. TMED37]|nr:MAG: hypothetical protein CBB97_16225 [Candidatus Endolissoclinum sp. TMED37]
MYLKITKPSAKMLSRPNNQCLLETECLFGEQVNILDENSEWVFCKLLTDNYKGWVKKRDLGNIKPPTHRVITNRSFLYKKNESKSDCFYYIPMGSQLSVKKIQKNWAEVYLPELDYPRKTAFVPSNHIVRLDHKTKDWVSIAEQLIGVPYKWGGRDTIGLDCSSLLQLSYQTFGSNIPRNTSEQVLLNKKAINKIEDLKRGYVVFWEGHVGIMVDNLNCLHANGHHMRIISEPLENILLRMNDRYKIIKILDFNN